MANANLCMFVYACTYVLGFTEWYVMCTYVAYVQVQNWQHQRERQTERETIKHRGLYCTFFLLKETVCKKQDHSLQCSIWVQIKNIVFNFDIVLKSVVGMQ